MTNKETKVTKKEYFNLLLEILDGIENTEDLQEFVTKEIERLDNRAAKEKERRQKKREQPDELMDQIKSILAYATDFLTIADIVKAINDEEITAGKVQSRLSKLVKNELVIKEDIAIEGIPHKRKGYKLV